MSRRCVHVAAASVLPLLLAGCAGAAAVDKSQAAAAVRSDITSSTSQPEARVVAQQPGGRSAFATAGAASAATTPTAASAAGTHLAFACVQPGGTQRLVVRVPAGYSVVFNSRYADGRMGDAYGGYGQAAVGSSGVAEATWIVSRQAPPGTVAVAVGTSNGGPPTVVQRSYAVADRC